MWKIEHIFDGEYGCEESNESSEPKFSITLVNEQGEKRYESATDSWLTKRKLTEGSIWPDVSEDEKEDIRRLSVETGYPYEWLLELYEGGDLPNVKF